MKPIYQFLICLAALTGCAVMVYRILKKGIADAKDMPDYFIEKDTPESRIFTEFESEVYEHSPESIFG